MKIISEKEYLQKIKERVRKRITPKKPKDRKLEETNESGFIYVTGINLN